MTFSITLVIIIISVAVSLYTSENNELHRKFLFNPYQVTHRNEWYRMISHGFIHKNLVHLGINMFVLYFFGRNVENFFNLRFSEMSGIYFVLLYIGGIIFATVPSMLKHKDNPRYNSLGASGAVSAVLFSAILLNPTENLYLYFAIPIPAIVFGGLYIGYEIYQDRQGGTGIAHDAHLWGALYGIVFTIILSPSYVITNFIDKLTNWF